LTALATCYEAYKQEPSLPDLVLPWEQAIKPTVLNPASLLESRSTALSRRPHALNRDAPDWPRPNKNLVNPNDGGGTPPLQALPQRRGLPHAAAAARRIRRVSAVEGSNDDLARRDFAIAVLLEIARENVRRAPHLKHRAAERLPGGH
jgi:hypothetical protein